MHGTKALIILISLLFSLNIWAAKAKYQCTNDDYEFNGQQVVLHLTDQKQQQVYFFRNLNDQTIWLNRPLLHASANAGWASELSPGRWSALLINEGPAVFDCAIMKANYQLESVACQDVISVCRLSHAKMKKKQDQGSYWLVEDSKGENTMLEQIKKRGISWQK